MSPGWWPEGGRTHETGLPRGIRGPSCAACLGRILSRASDCLLAVFLILAHGWNSCFWAPAKHMGCLLFQEKISFWLFVFLSEINLVEKSCWVGQVGNSEAALCRNEVCWHTCVLGGTRLAHQCCVLCGTNNCCLFLCDAGEHRRTVSRCFCLL